jgi:taspase (threonine aspartase 1)
LGTSKSSSVTQIQLLHPEALISPHAKEEWEKWKRILDGTRGDETEELMGLRDAQDTVGAVAWDSEGEMAAGVSR